MTHGKNKAACTCSDNALEKYYYNSQFIWIIINELRCNSWTFRTI